MATKLKTVLFGRVAGAIAACMVLATCATLGADDGNDKSYSIKLSVPDKVGDKETITVSGSHLGLTIITVGNKPPIRQEENESAKLTGDVETLAVDSEGEATKFVCTVKSLVSDDGKEILPAGSVVTAEWAAKDGDDLKSGKTAFSLKDGTLTPDQTKALNLVLEAHNPNMPADDKVFGTDKPQKVGGTWGMNKELAARSLPFSCKPEDLDGEFTLAAITSVAGKEFLQVKGTINVKNAKLPLPAGFTMTRQKLNSQVSTLLPADGAGKKSADSLDFEMDFTATGAQPDGTPVTLETTQKMHREGALAPAKSN